MKPVLSVWYNGGAGKEKLFALVTKHHGGHPGLLDLLVFDGNGAGSHETSVPHREPGDYDEQGGGRTWHEGE